MEDAANQFSKGSSSEESFTSGTMSRAVRFFFYVTTMEIVFVEIKFDEYGLSNSH